jgi:hypothetical protein
MARAVKLYLKINNPPRLKLKGTKTLAFRQKSLTYEKNIEMSHTIVKLKTDPFGNKAQNTYWHLSIVIADSDALCCTGEVYGYGVSEAKYKTKDVLKGGITCPECVSTIKKFKNIKL